MIGRSIMEIYAKAESMNRIVEILEEKGIAWKDDLDLLASPEHAKQICKQPLKPSSSKDWDMSQIFTSQPTEMDVSWKASRPTSKIKLLSLHLILKTPPYHKRVEKNRQMRT